MTAGQYLNGEDAGQIKDDGLTDRHLLFVRIHLTFIEKFGIFIEYNRQENRYNKI